MFRSYSDGSHYPLSQKGISTQTFKQVAGQDHKRTRNLSRKQRARLSTLENPLLYSNFVKKLERLNPDFDLQLIDRTLEPEEALMDLKRRYPELDIGLKENEGAQFREFLDEYGISNTRIQNLVAMQEPPLSEDELATLSYVLNNRPPHNLLVDEAMKAPPTTDLRRYSNAPNRFDIKGFKY